MKRVFLIHGWGAKPTDHWFPWLTQELEARYIKVFAPAMPRTDFPELGEWVSLLSSWVGRPDGDTHFVGHSLGCITILRYLETLREGKEVGTCVLVGGFKDDIGEPEISEFTAAPLDIAKVRSHNARFVSLISDNDDTVPTAASLALSHVLDAKTIILRAKGHFCKEDGVTALPEVLAELS